MNECLFLKWKIGFKTVYNIQAYAVDQTSNYSCLWPFLFHDLDLKIRFWVCLLTSLADPTDKEAWFLECSKWI